MHRVSFKSLVPTTTKILPSCSETNYGISKNKNGINTLLGKTNLVTRRCSPNSSFNSNRLYHCKTSVYGFNASLQLKRNEENADPKNHGLDNLSYKRAAQPNLHRYVEAFRRHGHKIANTNPVKPRISELPNVLSPSY